MNSQLTDHGCYEHEDHNFHEAADEFMSEENELGDHDIADAPQISRGGHVTEHSVEHSHSQKMPQSLEEKGECTILTQQPVDLHVPKGSSSDILSSEEEKHGDQKEASTLSQSPQDQEQQQPFFVDKLCSDPLKEEQERKIMQEDIEHPAGDHEGKTQALQDPDDAGNSLSISSIKSSVEELQGAMRPTLRSQEEEKQHDIKKMVEKMEASIPSQNPPDQQQQEPLPVELPCSYNPPLKQEEEARKCMAENPLEHATDKHEEEALEKVGIAASSHIITSMIESNELRPPNSQADQEERMINSGETGTADKRTMSSSHIPPKKRFFSTTKALFSVIASTFGLWVVMKLLRRS